jgi:hypothetical protein
MYFLKRTRNAVSSERNGFAFVIINFHRILESGRLVSGAATSTLFQYFFFLVVVYLENPVSHVFNWPLLRGVGGCLPHISKMLIVLMKTALTEIAVTLKVNTAEKYASENNL